MLAPGQKSRGNREREGKRELVPMRWDLCRHGGKRRSRKRHPLSMHEPETLAEMFRSAFKRNRCLIRPRVVAGIEAGK